MGRPGESRYLYLLGRVDILAGAAYWLYGDVGMRQRAKEPRIVNPQTHPRRYVSLAVAADFLEVDRQTLNKWLTAGLLAYQDYGTRRKIAVSELVAFEQRQHRERRAV